MPSYDELLMAMASQDHPEFDAICAQLEDFEHLPTIAAHPSNEFVADMPRPTHAQGAIDEGLNDQILAGLVTL